MAKIKSEDETADSNGWTVATLEKYTTALIKAMSTSHDIQMCDLKDMLRERFEAQKEAVREAFTAQQTALSTGLSAAERGVETALASQKETTTKAEVNANARFEQFRVESGLQIKTLSDKMDSEIGRITERLGEMANRLDLTIGKGVGTIETQTKTRLDNGQLMAFGGLLVALTAVLAGLFFK